jgi:hypothetical protein
VPCFAALSHGFLPFGGKMAANPKGTGMRWAESEELTARCSRLPSARRTARPVTLGRTEEEFVARVTN